MLEISKRIINMPASAIRKLAKYAVEAKKKGIHIYHINIGQPDIETPCEIRDAIKKHDNKIVAYTPSQGLPEYIDKLSEYYKAHGFQIEPDEIIVTTGGSEALLFTMMAVADPGDEIIIPEPFYTNYNGFAYMSGVRINPVTTYLDDSFRLPSNDVLKKNLTDRTKAVLFCNPNNPTGAVYSKKELKELAGFCLENDLFLISDEAYCEITQQEKIISLLSIEGIDDNAVIVDSESKRYSLCGARVGRIISKNKSLLKEILKCSQARLCPPYFGQIVGMTALTLSDQYLIDLAKEYQKRIDTTCNELDKIEGVKYFHSEGAFYIIVKLPVDNTEKFAKYLLTDFYSENLETGQKESVMVAPASGFYRTNGLGLDEIRIACVLESDIMKRSIQILKEGILKYNEI